MTNCRLCNGNIKFFDAVIRIEIQPSANNIFEYIKNIFTTKNHYLCFGCIDKTNIIGLVK